MSIKKYRHFCYYKLNWTKQERFIIYDLFIIQIKILKHLTLNLKFRCTCLSTISAKSSQLLLKVTKIQIDVLNKKINKSKRKLFFTGFCPSYKNWVGKNDLIANDLIANDRMRMIKMFLTILSKSENDRLTPGGPAGLG